MLTALLLVSAAPAWAHGQSPDTPAEAPPPPAAAPPPPASTPAPAPAHAPAPAPESFPTRSIRVGASFDIAYLEPFEKTSPFGPGFFGAYEFYLKPSFAIGVNLSYRFYPGQEQLHQIGYGLLMKHYLWGASDPDATFMPFVEYGLLLHINIQSGHKSTGTAHDTRLSAGTDFRIAKQIFFIEGSWHYSRLGLFESPKYPLDYVEMDLGYRYPW
jgi:hypothetical protein